MALESWHLVFGANDVNDSYNIFIDIFMKHYNHCCPMKEHKCKKHHKAWITNSLKDACKKKNKLYVAFKKNPTFQNECKYKKYKNKLTNILRTCEETYYSNKLDKVKADNKETWRVLNEILNRKNAVYAINLKTIMMANIYIRFQKTLPMDLINTLQILVLHSQAKYL